MRNLFWRSIFLFFAKYLCSYVWYHHWEEMRYGFFQTKWRSDKWGKTIFLRDTSGHKWHVGNFTVPHFSSAVECQNSLDKIGFKNRSISGLSGFKIFHFRLKNNFSVLISTHFAKSAKGCKHETLPLKPSEYHVWSKFPSTLLLTLTILKIR